MMTQGSASFMPGRPLIICSTIACQLSRLPTSARKAPVPGSPIWPSLMTPTGMPALAASRMIEPEKPERLRIARLVGGFALPSPSMPNEPKPSTL